MWSTIRLYVKRNLRENIRIILIEENLNGISEAKYHVRNLIDFIEDGLCGIGSEIYHHPYPGFVCHVLKLKDIKF